MRWWRRRAPEPVVEVPEEHDLAGAADREAAARRRARTEAALRSALVTSSGQCVVDVLVAPWLARQQPWLLDAGPLPPAEVLLAAFRLLRDDPPMRAVEDFVAAEPIERRAFLPPPPREEDRLRFLRERPRHVDGWRMPGDLDLTTHAAIAQRLRALDAVARRTGSGLPDDEVLGNPRWWPGRQAEPEALSHLLYGMWRRAEARSVDPLWFDAWRDASDLLYKAVGLPAVSPEAWVVVATDHAVRRLQREQP